MDAKEFNELVRDCTTNKYAMERFCLYCIGNLKAYLILNFNIVQDAEDFAHDIFLGILQNLPRKYIFAPLKWLHKIADNFVFTYRKKNKTTLELLDNLAYDPHIEERFENDDVNEALKLLDEKSRKIVILHLKYGYPLKEIARMFHASYPGIRTRSSRAIKFLQKTVTKLRKTRS